MKLYYCCCILLAITLIKVAESQNGATLNPFQWYKPDNFDTISRKMDKANPENCATMSESDLRLPPTALSQLPQYNQIPRQKWFSNRTKLLHLHDLALNRAFFYSYIYQRLDDQVKDPPFLPSLMYYYLSASADVSASPNGMNASAVLMDTNTTYANWYGLKVINRTLPLFGPMARRLDNWNDEYNFLRMPNNNTIKIYDMGAGLNHNYTAPWYKNNPYIRDREMDIDFIPDQRGTAPSKSQYTTKTQLATINGDPIEQLETNKFYGPNAPGFKETFLPVRFTRPYYDCGASNRWIVSSVAALSDYMPRYSQIRRLRGPRMVGIIVQSMDFYRIDFNPCSPGLGNPTHFLAGIDRCKESTLCVPLTGYGFRRGGYECVCKPGHRLPYAQNGPFQGADIEMATAKEYAAGFDCLSVGWREVIPEETGLKGSLERRRRETSVDVGFFDDLEDMDHTDSLDNSLWRRVKQSIYGVFKSFSQAVKFSTGSTDGAFMPAGDGDISEMSQLPSTISETQLIMNETTNKTFIGGRHSDYVAGGNSLNHLVPSEGPLTNESKAKSNGLIDYDSRTSEIVDGRPYTNLKRRKRDIKVPFYTVGVGTVFDSQRFSEAQNLIAHATKVTSQNCQLMTPEQLLFPGEVSYGAEVQFEMVGRTALRLAHFLSAYYQNNMVGEMYGSLITGFPINRHQLFGEVYANVLSSFEIVSSGIFFDYQTFTGQDGVTWDLFAPYAFKPVSTTQAVEAIDMSVKPFRDYTEKPWFRTLKERWVSSRHGLERIITKPFIRSDVNGTQLQRYFNFPMEYRVPYYEDGYWTQPYFDCGGKVKDWLITYAAPFFGYSGEGQALRFMGVTTVSVRLDKLDINQCPQSFYTPNFFKNTARCDFKTTYCTPIPRRNFISGSYKCECRQGFEYPFNDRTWYFHGEMMEREYQLYMLGIPNRFGPLRCRQGRATRPGALSVVFTLIGLTTFVNYAMY